MIRAALVGLGRIGALNEAAGAVARSHLAAMMATPGLKVVALVDPDKERRRVAAARFPTVPESAFAVMIEAVTEPNIDMVVLATPPGGRDALVEQALALRPRLLFVEKPLSTNAAVGRKVVAACRHAGATLRVNFHRRLDPGHRRMRAIFHGRPLAVTARYGKGLANYGSHLVDLLIDWCGPIQAIAASDPIPPGDDPSIGFRCRFADGGEAAVVALDGADYDSFDVDFFYRGGRIELAAGGAERRVWRAVPDRHYPGYAHLVVDAAASETSPVGGLAEFYAAAREHLEGGAPLPGCSGDDAVAGLDVLDAVHRSAAAHGGVQNLQA